MSHDRIKCALQESELRRKSFAIPQQVRGHRTSFTRLRITPPPPNVSGSSHAKNTRLATAAALCQLSRSGRWQDERLSSTRWIQSCSLLCLRLSRGFKSVACNWRLQSPWNGVMFISTACRHLVTSARDGSLTDVKTRQECVILHRDFMKTPLIFCRTIYDLHATTITRQIFADQTIHMHNEKWYANEKLELYVAFIAQSLRLKYDV